MKRTTTVNPALTSGATVSFWINSVTPLQFEALNQDIQTEVLVAGGGIAGLTTAYMLAKTGKQVVLVEDGFIGSGESGRTTAHLAYALDDRYYDIEQLFGEEGSRLAAESHRAAIDQIESHIQELHIDCHFKRVDGYLFLHPSDKLSNLEKELAATHKAGLPTQWMNQVPGMAETNGPCIAFPNQAQMHIMKYLHGLAAGFVQLGGKIYTQSKATNISKHGVTCNGYAISAQHIVVATNTPVNDVVTMHTK